MKDRIARSSTGLVALTASLAVAGLIAGCGASSNGAGNAGNLVSETPTPVGTASAVTWDLPFGEPTSLDPIKSYNYSENTVLGNICDSLLRLDANYHFKPGLAKSWSHPGPNTWIYNIRPGVKFWDGKPLTASDVAFNLKRNTDPKIGSFYYEPFGAAIDNVHVTGPLQVTVTTSRPSILTNEMMVTGLGTIAEPAKIQSAGNSYGSASGGVMCTGPYELQKWKSGQSITLTRNPHYWDHANPAKSEKLTFQFITDNTTLTNALVTGQVQGTYEAPVSAISRLQDATSGSLYVGPSTQFFGLFPTGTPALKDVRLRRALSLSLDRSAIAKTVYSGTAEPLKSIFLLPIDYAWATQTLADGYKALPALTTDLPKASSLVKQAGAPTTPLKLAYTAGDVPSEQIANALVDAAGKAGIRINTHQVPAADFIGLFFDPKAREQYDLMATSGYADLPDPFEYFELAGVKGSVQNFTDYNNPTVTKAVRAGEAAANPETRATYALQAVKQIDRDLPIIPVVWLPERTFLDSSISGAPPVFPYQYHPWAAPIGRAK